jgi:RNA polymerase sigma-70 factor (ECF subfamily)
MLKTLGGFSTQEIASAFLCNEETISKRLYRTKEFFREHKLKPIFPQASQLKHRVDAVLKTIYLIFNEGYNASHNDNLIRNELMEQAIYLGKLLCRHQQTKLPQVFAALALMCLHYARTESRLNEDGELILLEDQDRSLWNRELIKEGNAYLNQAAFGDTLSTYHLEAAIAFEHCTSPSLEQTNWQRILAFYDLLLTINPNQVVALNRLAVIYKLQGAEEVVHEIGKSVYISEWENDPVFYSLLGDVYAGIDKKTARKNLEQAIALTTSIAEKKLLNKKMMRI